MLGNARVLVRFPPIAHFILSQLEKEVRKGQEKEYSEHKRHHSRRWSECIQPSPNH